MSDKETPEQRRERLRQEEIKNNIGGNLNDSINKSNNGNLVDLVGSLGWKGTGILIIVIILGYIIYSLFFS
ncbi:DUF6366 family protein [Salinibacillus xinjiangensis]|uniref:Phage capsid protein n=1 Tax=Salinibacillus xinjiangensis TaxID=1229268 RepID=A0A6G1X4Q2_9BACI|nr:DUF6366 family protein [Salinibacillus xinjiangensis]MRG85922.1 hypothetical protein [Salinibacillus xinjiangensis]